MKTQTNVKARALEEQIGLSDMLIPGNLSKLLVRNIDPENESLLYSVMVITGALTQATMYLPAIYGAYGLVNSLI